MPIDIDKITQGILGGQWKAIVVMLLPLLAAIINGLIIRVSKEDVPIPFNIPSKFRPWVVILLGVVEAAITKMIIGIPLATAIIGALIAGVLPMVMHDLVIESLRNGRELFAPTPKFAPPKIPQAPKLPMFMLVFLVGCGWSQTKVANVTSASADLAVCILQHSNEPIEQIMVDCQNAAIIDIEQILKAHKKAIKYSCGSDGAK